jgi:hypothetical protein
MKKRENRPDIFRPVKILEVTPDVKRTPSSFPCNKNNAQTKIMHKFVSVHKPTCFMKKLFTLFVLFLALFQGFASEWTNLRSDVPTPAQKTLISSNIESSVIRFSMDGFLTSQVTTQLGDAVVLSLDDATPMLEAGAPDLPKMTASVIIPDLARMDLEVLDATYRDIENIFIAPSKGNLTRDIDPSSVPYEFGTAYQTDAFFPGGLAGLREPYILRDYRGQTIIVYPFQYNPVTRTLRVYTDITVRLSRVDDQGTNQLVRPEPLESVDAQFNLLYKEHFLNGGDNGSRYTPVEEYGNMLIISYGAFMAEMQPFVNWKKQIGYPVEMVDVGTIGNSSAIKTFIANYYNTKGVTFVLLVGDGAQVPTSSTSAGPSDNNYAYIVGSDHYPDLFIGRFSAENVSQVQTQVQRTLMYEQNPPTTVDWFTKCTGVASDQGPGDDGEYDYQHIRNIQNNKLIPFTYTYANELFDGSQGGNDAGGNPTPSLVAAAINAGTSIINYTGHGSQTSWGTSGFSNGDVNNLVNDNMLPFVWSVACVNGDFVNSTCFAEAWLRATHNGQPTGAVAFLGSTINQSWNPPMCGQDEMNDILVETYANNINRTFGALSMHGCMLMNDEYGGGGNEMTDTWLCFGDASLMVRTAVPQTMTVTHDPVLFIGVEEMQIFCDANGGRATLSLDGTTLSTGVVENGSVTLEFMALTAPGTVTLTITGFNYLPYIAGIDVIPADGPFVVLDAFDILDPQGNNNGLADYDESIDLTVTLENVGIEDAENVTVTLTTSDPYVVVTDYSEVYDVIPAGGTATIESAFGFHVSSDVPDQHQVIFSLNSTDGDHSWQSNLILNANAPILSINSIAIDDSETGNGDGELDPGERADLTIDYSNTGHATAYDVDVYLEGQSGFVEITNPIQNFAAIGFFGVFEKTFTVVVDEEAPEGIKVDFVNELTMGDMLNDKIFKLKISPKIEDFETGDLSAFNWQTGGNQPWQVVMPYPYQGYYSVKSGAITHSQSTELSVSYEVMSDDSLVFYRKVSSETSDYLQFYINNQLAGQWSGNAGGWKREAFAVTEGNKTFKWVYVKNGMGSGGSDCAWLDYIVFPSPMALTIWAGPNDEVCPGNSYQLNESYGTDFSQIEWTTSGSGSFNNNTIMHPIYNPSGDDLNSGEVILSLTLWNGEGTTVSDEMTLNFAEVPAGPVTPLGPDYIDLTVTLVSDYSVTAVEGADSYNWTLEPATAGTIIPVDETATISWNSNYVGTAFLTVTAVNDCGESAVSPALEITLDNSLINVGEPGNGSTSLTVYPNPASGSIYLTATGTGQPNLKVSVYNLLGSLVKRYEGVTLENGETFLMDASAMPDGIYLLTIEGKDILHTQKLIVR